MDVSTFEDGFYLFCGTGARDAGYGNSADGYEQYKANGVYFANFTLTYH